MTDKMMTIFPLDKLRAKLDKRRPVYHSTWPYTLDNCTNS